MRPSAQDSLPLPGLLPASQPLSRFCPGGPQAVLPRSATHPCNPLFQPNLLYMKLKKQVKAVLEEGNTVQEGAQDIQERALIQVLRQPCGEWWGGGTLTQASVACDNPASRRQRRSSSHLTSP